MSALLWLFLALSARAEIPFDSQPMPVIELPRYMGRWYEIARYPKFFERGCHAVTADYSLEPDGSVRFVNSCRKGSVDGRLVRVTAKVWSVHPSNSRFRVRFFWPFSGPYWIVAVDPKYQWAVIGHPKKKSLWILSRSPRLSPDVDADVLRRVAALGYDPARLERGGQPDSR